MTKILHDDDGNKYEVDTAYPLTGNKLVVRPLPHPPAKETYFLEFGPMSRPVDLVEEQLDLTPDAAEAVAAMLRAAIGYVQSPHHDSQIWKTMDNAIEKAREAIQDGSAA